MIRDFLGGKRRGRLHTEFAEEELRGHRETEAWSKGGLWDMFMP